MTATKITVGNVEIASLSDGLLEFDLCNFFPDIPAADWVPFHDHLTPERKVSFNLACFLVRSEGKTIAVDTGLGAKDTPKPPGANCWTTSPATASPPTTLTPS